MQTFGEQLTAARKAKGMTQEAFASAAAVTRQTISSWERGRTVPDIDTIRRLSDILGTDLIRAAEGERAPAADNIVPPEGQSAPAAAGKRQIKKWWIVAGAAALICVVLLSFLLFPRKSAPAGGGETFDTAFYQQETPNEAGKAFFKFDNRTWVEESDTSSYQMYEIVMHEQNGIAFSATRAELKAEGVSGVIRTQTWDVDGLHAAYVETEIPAYGTFHFTGGFPVDQFVRVGVAIYGNDANGEPMSYYTLIEF